MKNEKLNLRLVITEIDDLVELCVERSGKSILSFANETPPKVRVVGFKQPRVTKERIYETAVSLADNFPEGSVGMIKHYIYSREREIYDASLELRRIMRKMIMSAESANIARSVINDISSSNKNMNDKIQNDAE